MCGITGIFDRGEPAGIDRSLLERMNARQFHRGPNEGGIHIEPGIGLAHRRLSIIDLSSGAQPLFNEDRSVVVVYNGEIYNHLQLARELTSLGHTFRTHCDTEVIVHAWEQWGESCVSRFRGMFAFALWDRNQQVMFLARDRLGIKPLYYSQIPNGPFVFASELKSITCVPGVSKELNPEAVEDFFAFGYVPDPKSILRGVWKLPPGHTLLLKRGSTGITPRQYWDIPFGPTTAMSEADACEELIDRYREAVRIHMMAEVPLGAFLSGGVDSSSIVAMMAEQSGQPVTTCSISFSDQSFDESAYASRVAAQYKTRHFAEQASLDDFALLDRLTEVYDEPFADSSAMPTYRLCELTKKHVTVALSGDGGDESFAGYNWYLAHMKRDQVRRCLPGLIRGPVFAALARACPDVQAIPHTGRIKSVLRKLSMDPISAYSFSAKITTYALRRQLFSPAFNKQLQGYNAVEVLHGHARNAPTRDPLSVVQYLDMKTYLPGDILTKVDRASMAHALEVRVPILDHEFIEWTSRLPPEMKLKNKIGKYIFKKALARHLPQDILYRQKMGFSVPIAGWLRGPLQDKILGLVRSPFIKGCGVFNAEYLDRIIEEHVSGKIDHSALIWSVLVFKSFLRRQTLPDA